MFSARQFGIHVSSENGDYERCLCPFHSDRKPSAWFNKPKGLFYCSVCDEGYNTFQLSKMLESEDFGLYTHEPGTFDLFETRGFETGFKGYTDYMESRFLEEWYCKDFLETNFDEDVIFPNYNLDGKREGSIIRRRKKTKVKFIKQTSLPIWPFEELKRGNKNVLLVEGLFSAARIRQEIIKQEVESFSVFSIIGVASKKLGPFFFEKNVLIYFDNDSGGRIGLENYRKNFPHHVSKIIKPSPDDMDQNTFKKFFDFVSKHFQK